MADEEAYRDLADALLRQYADPQTAFRNPLMELSKQRIAAPLPTLPPLPYNRPGLSNLGPRPADAMAPVSETLWEANPIMQGKGLADLLHDTYGKGREGDWEGAASNLPWLLAGTVIPFPGRRGLPPTASASKSSVGREAMPAKPSKTYDDAVLDQRLKGLSNQQVWNRRDEIGRELNAMRRGTLPHDQDRHSALVAELDRLMASQTDPHNYRVYEMGFAGEPKENNRWWIDKRSSVTIDPSGRPMWTLLRGTYKNKNDGFRTREEAEAFLRSLKPPE